MQHWYLCNDHTVQRNHYGQIYMNTLRVQTAARSLVHIITADDWQVQASSVNCQALE